MVRGREIRKQEVPDMGREEVRARGNPWGIPEPRSRVCGA